MNQRNPIRLLLLSILMHFVVLAPPAALAREISVDEECSLHDAITTYNTETSTGGCHLPSWGKPRIYLKTDIILTEALPAIVTDLTIDGWGHQISGDKLHQVFVVYNHQLTINNLHIVDGFSDEHGGAIYVHGGEVSLSNSSIKNSLAVERGGAIYASNGSVFVSSSEISGNVAERGSAAYLDGGELNVSASSVTDNVATGSGTISVFQAGLYIVDTHVESNFAKEGSGGISAAHALVDIKHSAINANRTLGSGGGLTLVGVNATIQDVSISNNLAGTDGGGIRWARTYSDFGPVSRSLKVKDSALTGNRAAGRGGAIFSDAYEIEISNSTFFNNKAGGNGGAVYAENSNATLTHVTIAQNAALNGGGVYLREPDIMKLRNSLLAGNTGGDCVGGLAGNKGNWIADGSCKPRYSGDPQLNPVAGSPLYFPLRRESLAINRAHQDYCLEHDQQGTPRPQGDACDIGAYEAVEWIEGEYDYRMRGTITSPDIIVNDECSLADAIASANRDEATGGCIAGAGPDVIRLTGDLKPNELPLVINSEIVIEGDNYEISSIQMVVRFGNLTLNNLTLRGGGATYHTDFNGGTIYVRYARLQMNSVTLKDSVAIRGGAIFSYDSDIVITNSILANNEAEQGRGGALNMYAGAAEISNSIISGNEATDGGGAIFGLGSPSIRITGSVINDNRTEGEGGGILVYGHVDLKDTSLQRNEAAKGGALAGRAYSSFDLENVDFVDNVAEDCPKEYNEIKWRCR